MNQSGIALASDGELLRDDTWSRTFRMPDGGTLWVSKFVTDEISLTSEALIRDWRDWSEDQRFHFVHAFRYKSSLSAQDAAILDFLMKHGDHSTRAYICGLLPKHPEREKYRTFLIEELQRPTSEPKASLIGALRVLGGLEAVAALRAFRQQNMPQTSAGLELRDLASAVDYAHCCIALATLENDSSFVAEIESLLDRSSFEVRQVLWGVLRHRVNEASE